MVDDAKVAAMYRELTDAIRHLSSTLENVKAEVRQLREPQGRFMTTSQIMPVSTNLSNIREMFLLEILRQKGLLDGVDLVAMEERVRLHLVEGSIPYGASKKSAQKNLETVKREIAGDYSDEDDD